MTGSRLLFWLHALTSAFNDSGYWSGVVICFSMRQPIMRASIGESSMFMVRDYHKREQGSPRVGSQHDRYLIGAVSAFTTTNDRSVDHQSSTKGSRAARRESGRWDNFGYTPTIYKSFG